MADDDDVPPGFSAPASGAKDAADELAAGVAGVKVRQRLGCAFTQCACGTLGCIGGAGSCAQQAGAVQMEGCMCGKAN
jgi:hypothetical protein